MSRGCAVDPRPTVSKEQAEEANWRNPYLEQPTIKDDWAEPEGP